MALAIAAVLGVGGSVRAVIDLRARVTADGPPAWADEAYAPLRPRLPAGGRIGVLVASGDPSLDVALHYAAQYALAPAVVEPIYLGDCLGLGGGKRCRVDGVDRIAFASTDPVAIASISAQLGLVMEGRVGGVVLLRKAPR